MERNALTTKFLLRSLSVFLLVVLAIVFSSPSGQTKSGRIQERSERLTWQDKLYETNVTYESFACNESEADIVAAYFDAHPLKSYLPVCHNDCPIVKCRPVVPFPLVARQARVSGSVAVHVLVDETGKVLYARALDGHPLLWAAVHKGACATQFREYPYGKHQGVMHFNVNGSEFLDLSNTANVVWR